jgi:hypothetical protein
MLLIQFKLKERAMENGKFRVAVNESKRHLLSKAGVTFDNSFFDNYFDFV